MRNFKFLILAFLFPIFSVFASNLEIPSSIKFMGTATAQMQLTPKKFNENQWSCEIPTLIKEKYEISFEDEIDMLKQLKEYGFSAYRFSLEWSEIEPEEGIYNQEAIEEIREKIRALKNIGIDTIMLTAHHFTDPKWLEGGFENEENIEKLARFCSDMFSVFAEDIDYFATINEPNIYAFMGYYLGDFPPYKKNSKTAARVLKNLLIAHMDVMRAIENHPLREKVLVGFTHQALKFEPYHRWSFGIEELICNKLSAITHDTIATFFQTGRFCYYVPFVVSIDEEIAKPDEKIADALFLQNYGYPAISCNPFQFNIMKWIESACYPGESMNEMGFRIDPDGLYNAIAEWSEITNLPIVISENGISAKEGNEDRYLFMKGALNSLNRAAKEQIPLLGYFYWSLVDNMEWSRWEEEITFGLFQQDENNSFRLKKETRLFIELVKLWDQLNHLESADCETSTLSLK